MTRLRIAFALAILLSLFATGTALAADGADLATQPAAVSTTDDTAAEAPAETADGTQAGCNVSADLSLDFATSALDNGKGEMVQTAIGKSCGPWYYIGCCGNQKKTRRSCCVGPDCWSETKCEGSCPL